jgi:hypothetical protein
MNIALSLDKFDINNLFFLEAIKNTIMNDSSFIKVIYSNEVFILNGLCLEFTLPITHIDKTFNKYKCLFDYRENDSIFDILNSVEYQILSKCNLNSKKATFRVNEQLKNGFIKVPILNTNDNVQSPGSNIPGSNIPGSNIPGSNIPGSNIPGSNIQSVKFLLKISGVWLTDVEYGLTYKFTQA